MNAKSEDQWRIDNASHLKGVRLHFRRYARRSESWDHDHCAACWAKFAEFDGPAVLHHGFATGADYKLGANYDWLCETCFVDLQRHMNWTTSPDERSG